MEKEWICIENICKSFHKNLVLDHIHASFYHGEICSILGENGSGKSTLMKILAGIYQPDEGRIFIHGEEKKIETPRSAMKLGISMIMQEPALAPSLSVEHNIFLGNELCHGHTPFVNRYVQQEKNRGRLSDAGGSFGSVCPCRYSYAASKTDDRVGQGDCF